MDTDKFKSELAELKVKLAEVDRKCDVEKRALQSKFALEHNPVKPGDIVTTALGSLKVDTIEMYLEFGTNTPRCRYTGVRYTRDRKPFKSGEIDTVYQPSVIDAVNSKGGTAWRHLV